MLCLELGLSCSLFLLFLVGERLGLNWDNLDSISDNLLLWEVVSHSDVLGLLGVLNVHHFVIFFDQFLSLERSELECSKQFIILITCLSSQIAE